MSRAAAEARPGFGLPSRPDGVKTPHSLTRERRHSPEREPRPRRIIAYAGESARRLAFAKAVNQAATRGFAGDLINLPGGEEQDISDTIAVMLRKIMVANQTIVEEKLAKPRDTVIIIAADIRTRIGASRINKGKPKNLEGVRRTFQRMARSDHPYYTVESSSGVRINNRQPSVTSDSTTILLDPKRVKYLSTPEGFMDYQRRFAEYYSSPAYLNDGNHKPIQITDLAAGLSLPVLIADNAVLEINGVGTIDPEFYGAVKESIYNVGIGFNLNLLKNVWPNVGQFVESYPWLENATTSCLRREPAQL
jgi:hypothetical protein